MMSKALGKSRSFNLRAKKKKKRIRGYLALSWVRELWFILTVPANSKALSTIENSSQVALFISFWELLDMYTCIHLYIYLAPLKIQY